jgi:hypothetical protein
LSAALREVGCGRRDGVLAEGTVLNADLGDGSHGPGAIDDGEGGCCSCISPPSCTCGTLTGIRLSWTPDSVSGWMGRERPIMPTMVCVSQLEVKCWGGDDDDAGEAEAEDEDDEDEAAQGTARGGGDEAGQRADDDDDDDEEEEEGEAVSCTAQCIPDA